MTSVDSLSPAFTELLEKARLDYVELLVSKSLPFTETAEQVLVIDDPEQNGWRSDSQPIEVSTARNYLFLWGKLNEQLRSDCLDLSADIIATYSATLPFWSGGFSGFANKLLGLPPEHVDFNSEPNTWVARYIVAPAMIAYIRALRSANAADISLAERIAREALNLSSSNHLKLTSYLPVVGIEIEDEDLSSGDIAVRKLTPIERGAILQQTGLYSARDSSDIFPYSHPGIFLLPDHVIEVTTKSGRMEQPQPGSYHKRALCAFFLHGYPVAGPGRMTSESAPRWISYGRITTPIQLRPWPSGSKKLRKDELGEIEVTLRKLHNYNLEQPANSRDLALHRFLLGATRENSVDSLLDYIIALECFLLPYDPATRHSDLSYRFRLHGAHYIGESIDERKNIWKQLRDLYDIRSHLVHGSQYPTPTEIDTCTRTAQDLSTRALLKAVRSHFPRVEEFNTWALR